MFAVVTEGGTRALKLVDERDEVLHGIHAGNPRRRGPWARSIVEETPITGEDAWPCATGWCSIVRAAHELTGIRASRGAVWFSVRSDVFA